MPAVNLTREMNEDNIKRFRLRPDRPEPIVNVQPAAGPSFMPQPPLVNRTAGYDVVVQATNGTTQGGRVWLSDAAGVPLAGCAVDVPWIGATVGVRITPSASQYRVNVDWFGGYAYQERPALVD